MNKTTLLVVALVPLAGCMTSRDGQMHTFFTGLQYDRAMESAEATGAVRARSVSGQVRWLDGSDADQFRAARSRAYETGGEVPPVDFGAGYTADDLRNSKYPAWLRAAAWLADGVTWGGIGTAVTYAGARAVEEVSDARSSRTTIVRVDGSGHTVVVQGGPGGHTYRRDEVQAEGGGL